MIRVILLLLYLGQFQSHPGDHETRNALRRPVWQFIAAEPPGNYLALATCLHIARPVAMAPVAPPSADSRSWTQAYADQRDLLGCVSFPRRHRGLSLPAHRMGGKTLTQPGSTSRGHVTGSGIGVTKSPVLVPRHVERITTLSPSAIKSSIVVWKSGKALRASVIDRL
jgi:hypothetical protein